MERTLNILLVEDDTVSCKRFNEYCEFIADTSICAITNNSYHALELVAEHIPDAIILDLELTDGTGNGILFLQNLHTLEVPFKPYILVTTNNSSKVTYDFARQLGADFIMSKHQEDYSEKAAIEFLRMMKDIIQNTHKQNQPDYDATEPAQQREKRLIRRINFELDQVGIRAKAVGYNYLTDAIFHVINDEPENIYAKIGQKYSKSDHSVQRAMQNAINSAWRTTDINDLLTYYTARISSDRGVPTLTEFIYHYANKIKNEG